MSKPKVTVTGKRFSRIETTTYPDDTPMEEIFKKEGRQVREGVWTMGSTFAERVQLLVEAQAAYLRSRGLPDAPRVFWAKDSEHWQTDPPARESFKRVTGLEQYVINRLGYPHDSPEGIAASIIEAASRMEGATKEAERMEAAFRLGELRTLAKIYNIVGGPQRLRARKPRKPDLRAIVDNLSVQDARAKELWPKLGGEMDAALMDPEEIEYNGQLAYLYINENGKQNRFTFRRFENMLSEARNNKSR